MRPIPVGSTIKGYDVNSLYPTSMSICDMPVGEPVFFELIDPTFDLASIKGHDKPFGFFNVDIETPDNLEHPIIQTRVKTGEGWRTIAPLGKWNDVLFSEEIYNSETYGYKFTIKSGYLFDKANIFKEYVETLFDIKQNTPSHDPMYLVAKLLMNSLYGKFGMSYMLQDHIIVTNTQLDKYINNPNIEVDSITNLSDNLVLISMLDNNKYLNYNTDINDSDFNISIGIASSITAYSRIFMSQFKNRDDFILYYSDTDSIYISGILDPKLVGNKLGQFKLENTFKDALFLAPKVYAGITTDDKLIVKIKGLTKSVINNDVTFDKLLLLLNKDKSLVFNQIKSQRSLSEGSINLLEQTYTLIPSESKRELVYKNNILVGTKPYIIDKNKQIK